MGHVPHDPVKRVNDKHAAELLAVARWLGDHPDATAARAERIDTRGIDIVLTTPSGPVETRLSFTEPVSDAKGMRSAFRELTRRAYAALSAEANESSA